MERISPGAVGQELDRIVGNLTELEYLGGHHLFCHTETLDPHTPDWDDLDRAAQREHFGDLEGLLWIEDFMARSYDWARVVSQAAFELVDTHIERYHDSLPFLGPERRWLKATWQAIENTRDTSNVPDDEVQRPDKIAETSTLRNRTGSVVMAGKTQRVSGDELLQRWWAWRRDVGEYSGTGSHTAATAALNALVALVRTREGIRARSL